MDGETMATAQHELMVTNRNAMEVTGVTRVESFDSEEFLLQTDFGYLGVRGQELYIKNLDLDTGRVAIEGQITDISYLDVEPTRLEKQKGFMGRLFK